MRADRRQIETWASELTDAEKLTLIADLVEDGMEREDICFYKSNIAPYWESCGEPLVFGQETHEPDECND